ncbi:Protein-methionine sulfoxide oxidase mical2b [Dissostichus eleginoides]|uniref:Protein-methionine sulfoxide oxidase mical2b n=1 Tax=Dissostichus eleginoides TaxID=100907 RepID=A0AAD9BHP6_DISEL|nr:Protein-methionine sulfoxide oxidase mical2b [Dissostichus eleginoides]
MIRVVPHQPAAIIIPLARAEEQPERSAKARRSLASRRRGASLRPPDVKGDRSPSVSGFPPPCLTLRPCALIPPPDGIHGEAASPVSIIICRQGGYCRQGGDG